MTNQVSLNLSRFNNVKFNVLEALDARIEKLQDFRLHELEDEKLELILNLFNAHKKATNQLNRFKKYINRLQSFTGLFEDDNLKLYDLSYHLYKNSDQYFIEELGADYDYFYSFCEDEYRSYEDWLNEETYLKEHHLIVDYVNRTSTFYYMKEDLNDFVAYFSDYNLMHVEVLGSELLNDDLTLASMEEILSNTVRLIDSDCLDDFDDYIEQVIDAMDMIKINFTIKEFKSYYIDQIAAYKYIKRFKNNQVEYFDSWFEGLKESFLY